MNTTQKQFFLNRAASKANPYQFIVAFIALACLAGCATEQLTVKTGTPYKKVWQVYIDSMPDLDKTSTLKAKLTEWEQANGVAHDVVAVVPTLKAKLLEWEQEAPERVKKAIETLRRGDSMAKCYAAVELGNMRAEGGILALMETLKDNGDGTGILTWGPNGDPTNPSMEAKKALRRIGMPAVEALVVALAFGDFVYRRDAVEVLGAIGDGRAVDPLIAALQDQDSMVRWMAAEALGKIGNKAAVEALLTAVRFNKDENVRSQASHALEKIGNKR